MEGNNYKILELTVAVSGTTPQKELNHALLYASTKGKAECAKILVSVGKVDVNVCNTMGMTGLMLAAQHGHDAIIGLLLTFGAFVNSRSVSGASALHYACQYGHYNCVLQLLKAGADINTQDKSGNTSLIAASKNCRYAPEVMEKLAECEGCKLNIQNKVGRTALHYVVDQADLVSWPGILLAAGANPNIQDNEGNTPFMLAATEGFDEVLKCLIAFHCDPDTPNYHGKSPIHFLAQKNHHHVIRFMMDLNCNFDPIDATGNIPLFYAVNHNRPEAVKALLRANCMLQPNNENGRVPLTVALEKKLWKIGKLLVLAGCDIHPLYPWLEAVEAEARARQRERLTLFEEQLEEEQQDEELNEAVAWFSDWLYKPHTLQQLTRIFIRACIGDRLVGKGRHLPIPQALQDYVTLKEVHDHHIEGVLM